METNIVIDSSTSSIDYYINLIKNNFLEDKIIENFEIIKLVEKLIQDGKISDPFCDKNKLISYFKSNNYIDEVYNDFDLIQRCQETFQLINNTKPERIYNGIETWFKQEENVNSITICGRTIIKSNLLHIFAVLSEVDLISNFINQFEEISKIKEITPFRWLIGVKIKMPITFTNRDLICCGTGILNKEEKNIYLMFKSVKNVLGEEVPKDTSSYKRIELIYGFYHIQYISDDCYSVTNCLNVDPKIPIIPWFILNKFIKESTYYIMDGLRSQIQNEKAKDVYMKRINEKNEFYDKLQKFIIL